ncbi:hypothetical protein ACFQGT_09750 [Natrialbaceae archaeon GCM10025810]|uniref:hypothetical protein n=1 Tax=Halovalidus salilacus TaxID=3075124 RepID=UPI00361A126F
MKPRYLTELFADDDFIQITSEHEIPRMRKPSQACQWDIPPRETVISDLLAHYPDYDYDQLAVMVSNIFGTGDREEIRFVDEMETEGILVAPSDLGVILP